MKSGTALERVLEVSSGGPIRAIGGKGIATGMVNDLGRCSAANRGEELWLRGASGVADAKYRCLKNASNTYGWVRTTDAASPTFALGPWQLNAVAGTATNVLLLAYTDTASSLALGTDDEGRLRMPAAGAVIGGWMITDSPRTAGTATLSVRLNGVNTTLASGGCVVNATHTVRNSVFDQTGVAFASGDTIGANIVTSSYTPTTDNWNAWLLIRLGV